VRVAVLGAVIDLIDDVNGGLLVDGISLSEVSYIDPLNLIERDLVTGAVVQLGCARAFVRGHSLGIFERAAGLEVGSNPGRAKYVAPDLSVEASFGRAPADHLIGIDTVHRPIRQHSGSAGRRAEEGGLTAVPDAGGVEIFIEELLELVVRRHLWRLPPFSCNRTHQRLPFEK